MQDLSHIDLANDYESVPNPVLAGVLGGIRFMQGD